MRHAWILLVLVACSTSTSSSGGGDDGGGDGGGVTCSGSLEGTSCNATAQRSCSIEGNPGCQTLPTSGGCDCGSDGTWHCYCACYGPQTTCERACPVTSAMGSGAMCDPPGYQCTYPDRTCTCDSDGTFHCS